MVGHMVGLVGAMFLLAFTVKAKERHAPECHSGVALRIPFSQQNTGVVMAHVIEYKGRRSVYLPYWLILSAVPGHLSCFHLLAFASGVSVK